MNADVAVARPLRAALQREWLLLVFAAVGVALAWIDPQPASAYRRWLHVPSLAGLTGLLIAIQAIGDSGLVQRAAAKLLLRMRSVRGVGLLMVWSSVPELPELIEDLAIDHGLAIYNPQGFTKNTGAYLRQAPYLKLDCGMGYPALNPRSEVLHSALDTVLDGEFEFAILSRKSGDYIQMAPAAGD